jgi:hypothetical protein
VEKWKRFKVGRTSVNTGASSEHSSTVTCVEVKEQIDQRIRDNRKMDVVEIGSGTSIHNGKMLYKNGLRPNGKMCYSEGIGKLVDRWNKRIESVGCC